MIRRKRKSRFLVFLINAFMRKTLADQRRLVFGEDPLK
jgi:hypothetical protein